MAFMCPKLCTNLVTVSNEKSYFTSLSTFLELFFPIAKNCLSFIQQIAHSLAKISLVGAVLYSVGYRNLGNHVQNYIMLAPGS